MYVNGLTYTTGISLNKNVEPKIFWLTCTPQFTECVCVCVCVCVNIYHYHHVVPPARISPTLSCHFSLSSPLAGLQGYILCPHIAAVCKFELVVLLLLGHMWGSITYELVLASPAVSCVSGLSNLYSFCDGRQVAV